MRRAEVERGQLTSNFTPPLYLEPVSPRELKKLFRNQFKRCWRLKSSPVCH
jgi:hypothetical protein